jgi:hypothetical protein
MLGARLRALSETRRTDLEAGSRGLRLCWKVISRAGRGVPECCLAHGFFGVFPRRGHLDRALRRLSIERIAGRTVLHSRNECCAEAALLARLARIELPRTSEGLSQMAAHRRANCTDNLSNPDQLSDTWTSLRRPATGFGWGPVFRLSRRDVQCCGTTVAVVHTPAGS